MYGHRLNVFFAASILLLIAALLLLAAVLGRKEETEEEQTEEPEEEEEELEEEEEGDEEEEEEPPEEEQEVEELGEEEEDEEEIRLHVRVSPKTRTSSTSEPDSSPTNWASYSAGVIEFQVLPALWTPATALALLHWAPTRATVRLGPHG